MCWSCACQENFLTKAGAAQEAAAQGVCIVAPDTSPRNCPPVEGEDESYDFGSGAGFYIDATQEPWKSKGYRMESYVSGELRALTLDGSLPGVDGATASIMGHSMGGHGALTLAFKAALGTSAAPHPPFKSVSAFSPICHPTNCPWGKKAFAGYLGGLEHGAAHDACVIMRGAAESNPEPLQSLPILVDQGTGDNFLASSESNGPQGQLQPEALKEAMTALGRTDAETAVRLQEGYDHSYFFISTFVGEHIAFHAKALK